MSRAEATCRASTSVADPDHQHLRRQRETYRGFPFRTSRCRNGAFEGNGVSMISSLVSKARIEIRLPRKNCQTLSTADLDCLDTGMVRLCRAGMRQQPWAA